MAEELKELLEKIQREGVDAAEAKKQKIETDAKLHAGKIIEDANKEANSILSKAREEIANLESSSRATLKQAARDMLIALREDIAQTMDKIIRGHVHKALDPAEIKKIILDLIKGSAKAGTDKIIITMNSEDLGKVEKALIGELGSEITKGGIELKHSGQIKGGFTISYDSGKSHYDFTDKSLADYMSAYLNPRLGKILEEAINRGA